MLRCMMKCVSSRPMMGVRQFTTNTVLRTSNNLRNKNFVIVGAGTAGISVAAQLKSKGAKNITIIAPNEYHDYQPGWTLVGADILGMEQTRQKTEKFIPSGAKWIQDSVDEFLPESNTVKLSKGMTVEYETLVIAIGLNINWGAIKGLTENMGKYGVCSNYSYETVGYTRDFVQQFTKGIALFSHPPTPVKCAGAPQKIMYLSEDLWRKKGIRDNIEVHFYTSMGVLFGVKYYAKALDEECTKRNLKVHFRHSLIEVRPNEAVFLNLDTQEQVVQKFDLLHATPHMGPPDVLRNSPLSDENGWLAVDKESLQHVKYKNVYGLGDCAGLPTSKTAAAISSQAPVLVENVVAGTTVKKYDGYTSCPIPVKKGGLILAEFDYTLTPRETLPFDQRVPSFIAYLIKVFVFPFMYWRGTLKGRWKGPSSLSRFPFLSKEKKYDK